MEALSKFRLIFKECFVDGIILIAVLLLIVLSMRRSIIPLCTMENSILLYRDIFPVLDKNLELCRYLNTWYCGADLTQLEMTSALWYQVLFLPLLYILPSYGCYQIITRLLILSFSFISSYISSIIVLKDILIRSSKQTKITLKVIVAITSLTCVFNPFLYSISADRLFMFSYSILPLYFAFLYKTLRWMLTTSRCNLRDTLRFSLILSLLYSLILAKINVAVYVIITTVVLILCVSLIMVLGKRLKLVNNMLKITTFAFLFVSITVMVNFHFVSISVQSLHAGVRPPAYDVNVDVVRLLAAEKNMFNSLTFQGGFWPVMDYSLPSMIAVIPILLVTLSYIITLKSLNSVDRLLTTLYLLIIVLSFGFIVLSYYAPEIYYKIFIQALPMTIGWIFRAPERMHVIRLPLMIIIFYVTVGRLLRKYNVKYRRLIIMTIVFLLGIYTAFNYVKVGDGYFGGVYRPTFYPEEWTSAKEFIEHNKSIDRCGIIFLPYTFNGYQWYDRPCWNIYPVSVNAEVFYTNIKEKSFPYILNIIDKNAVAEIRTCLRQLGIKYVIVTKDVRPSNENELLLLNILKNTSNIEKIFETGKNYEVYELRLYDTRNKIYTAPAVVFSDRIKCLLLPVIEMPLHYSMYIPYSAMILYYTDSNDSLIDMKESSQVILIAPAAFTPYSGVESGHRWVRGYVSDPIHASWHPYLKGLDMENWQTDYGYGVVFTEARLRVPVVITISANDTVVQWSFKDPTECCWWREYTPLKQFNALQSLICYDDVLKVKLYNSTWGWKTIRSPLISVDPNHAYRFVIRVHGINAHKVHIKIAEFDSNKKLIDIKWIKDVGDGTFNWKEVAFDYVSSSSKVRYVQLQVWHGHLTDKPLPNVIIIDYIKVYDVTKYAKRITLDMPFDVTKPGKYKLFVRYFENERGGAMGLYLDGKPIALISTSSQLNRFVWKDLGGTFELGAGQHTLTLENVRGFNAVNVFVLVPVDEYDKLVNELEKLLENKTIIYILEAESDMFRSKAKVIENVNASDGEMLYLEPGGYAWQGFKVVKDGYYMMAVRLNGSARVLLDNRSFNVSSNTLSYRYLGPVYLNHGNHTILVKTTHGPLYLDITWLYSVKSLTSNMTLTELFRTRGSPAKVLNYERINPTLWKAEVAARKPFMLVFAEAYDPLWEARVYKNGALIERVGSIPVYGVINGFWINTTGNLTIIIRYVPQDLFELGLKISATTFVLCIFYLVWDWRRGRGDKWAVWLEEKTRGLVKSARHGTKLRHVR